MKVDLKSGQAVITPKAGTSFDPTEISGAVEDAGFSPGDIEVMAVGTLSPRTDLLLLEMPGRLQSLVLAGGTRAEELKKRTDLVGQRLRVRGKLHPSHADKPPGLTVEHFETLAARSPGEKKVSVKGRLTAEGIECQAFRSADGVLYTLVGNLQQFKAGDEVCVAGTVAEASICMQGTTLAVQRISRECQ